MPIVPQAMRTLYRQPLFLFAFLCSFAIHSNGQEYIKASYIDSEGTGWWKGLDMNGFSITAGKRESLKGKSFLDFQGVFSYQGADAFLTTPSIGGSTYTYTADLSAFNFTFQPIVGYNITEKISVYAGPSLGASLWTSDETVTRNSDGASVTAFGAEATWHWGYGVGSTIKLSENWGLDFGWKHVEHSDFELFPGYENEYWHFGVYMEF